ncbi:MAG: amidinotransferase [Arenimonas sp.]|uniref:arginine deiminase-related protein n=1 Tax=Arenimonas sp. TaxID=1872635 RepID=UPI0025C70A9A|nr:arginine deiminase-related protein [Arenimonas sp.]MBW8366545.1 amidinotransferase [Arenimonas sp.]
MITRDAAAFGVFARAQRPDFGPACAKAAFLVTPEGFALAAQSASDNAYMDLAVAVDPLRALAQHRDLHRALSASLPVVAFPGDPAMPDGLFPNNVFGTAPGRLVIGHMRHAVRQREAGRTDIRGFFAAMGYAEHDLRAQPGVCELTGALVIDRARGLGYCGLSERCDEAGAAAMHAAFGLRGTLMFDLAPGEYHTNVVMSVLAGRALVACPAGFADPAVAAGIAAIYAPHVVELSPRQKAAFAGNGIALSPDRVWMSQAGAASLQADQHARLQRAGFTVGDVALDEIEKAGGSLRCCVAEIF